jgi:hypothetical protein
MELVNYPVFFVDCDICKHHIEGQTCKAFPNGIPKYIYGIWPHKKKVPEQQGDYVFELCKLEENASEELRDYYKQYKEIEDM